MLHTSINLYLMGVVKGVISASCCITIFLIEIKRKYGEVIVYTLTHTTYLGPEELKHE